MSHEMKKIKFYLKEFIKNNTYTSDIITGFPED